MNRSENIDQLAVALAKAQAEISSAPKQSQNPFFNVRYADLAAVWEAAKGGLTKNGLSISQFAETEIREPGGTIVSLTTMLLHSSGQWLLGELRIVPAKTDAQSIGSCLTYMRRYSLAAIAGVVTEDDDGNAASGNAARVATAWALRKRPAAPAASRAEREPAPAFKPHGRALELVDLVGRICALKPDLTPDAVIGSFFKTSQGKPLSWFEVKGFHTPKQLAWAVKGIAALRQQYGELLAQHPEDVSQEPEETSSPRRRRM